MQTHPLRAAVERRDLVSLAQLLAPEANLVNPVNDDVVSGRDNVTAQFGRALDGFDDFAYTHELKGRDSYALVFSASHQGEPLEGMDLFCFDDDGLVSDVTVMIRPMSVLAAVAEAHRGT